MTYMTSLARTDVVILGMLQRANRYPVMTHALTQSCAFALFLSLPSSLKAVSSLQACIQGIDVIFCINASCLEHGMRFIVIETKHVSILGIISFLANEAASWYELSTPQLQPD